MDVSPYRAHRARFLETLFAQDAVAVVPTAPARTRNHDCEYRYRPDSDFWYLTGFAEPEATLVLLPAARGDAASNGKSVLFLREKDREREIWTGRRLGVAAAPAALGVDEAHPIDELEERLPDLLRGHERLVYRAGDEPAHDALVLGALAQARAQVRAHRAAPRALVDPAATLHEQRLFKTEAELERMRRAAAITAEAHLRAMARSAPGRHEHEIDALLLATFMEHGSTGPAYTNIVAGGANACILHYVENDQPLADGDLLLIDAGAEVEYYASDVTRTFPVNGRFSAEQRALYDVVLDAQLAAIAACRPGATIEGVHDVAVRALVEGVVALGLLEGPAEARVSDESYKRFYMHRTSHWLGLDVHDRGAYVEDGASRAIEPGQVLTVEPGLYVAADDETVDARWRGIGIRIEDDVLIRAGEPEVLTAAIPKTPEAVEAACGAPASAPA